MVNKSFTELSLEVASCCEAMALALSCKSDVVVSCLKAASLLDGHTCTRFLCL